MQDALARLVAVAGGELALVEPLERAAPYLERALGARAGVGVVKIGKVAVVPLAGVVVPKAGELAELFGFAGLDLFRGRLQRALTDRHVEAVVLAIDSPGGTVAGTPEARAAVERAAAVKPVVAVADGMAASAAYWIAVAASAVHATPSSDVGSIGAMAMHMDMSGALARFGMKPTIVTSAARKADLSPYRPLPARGKAWLEARVQEMGAEFVATVARLRRVDEATVRSDAWGAGTIVRASAALEAGMIDGIAELEAVVAALGRAPEKLGVQARGAANPAPASSSSTARPGTAAALARALALGRPFPHRNSTRRL